MGSSAQSFNVTKTIFVFLITVKNALTKGSKCSQNSKRSKIVFVADTPGIPSYYTSKYGHEVHFTV